MTAVPKSEKNKSVSLSLPEPLYAQLVAEADKRMVHVSYLVRRAVEKYLPQLPPLDGLEGEKEA